MATLVDLTIRQIVLRSQQFEELNKSLQLRFMA
jgi:hypothetical protein